MPRQNSTLKSNRKELAELLKQNDLDVAIPDMLITDGLLVRVRLRINKMIEYERVNAAQKRGEPIPPLGRGILVNYANGLNGAISHYQRRVRQGTPPRMEWRFLLALAEVMKARV